MRWLCPPSLLALRSASGILKQVADSMTGSKDPGGDDKLLTESQVLFVAGDIEELARQLLSLLPTRQLPS